MAMQQQGNSPCGDQDLAIYRATLHMKGKNREYRKKVGRWLVDHCGRPDRLKGFWWTEDGRDGDLIVCFVLPEHYTEFWMRWC